MSPVSIAQRSGRMKGYLHVAVIVGVDVDHQLWFLVAA